METGGTVGPDRQWEPICREAWRCVTASMLGTARVRPARWARARGPDHTLAFILQRIVSHGKDLQANLPQEGLGCQVKD